MKKILILITQVISSALLFGQSIPFELVSTSCASENSSSYQIDWSIGELQTERYSINESIFFFSEKGTSIDLFNIPENYKTTLNITFECAWINVVKIKDITTGHSTTFDLTRYKNEGSISIVIPEVNYKREIQIISSHFETDKFDFIKQILEKTNDVHIEPIFETNRAIQFSESSPVEYRDIKIGYRYRMEDGGIVDNNDVIVEFKLQLKVNLANRVIEIPSI